MLQQKSPESIHIAHWPDGFPTCNGTPRSEQRGEEKPADNPPTAGFRPIEAELLSLV